MIAELVTVVMAGLLLAGSAALYLLPVLIGIIRRVPGIGALAVINVLLGWTLFGWLTALAMALRSAPTGPPVVQVIQNFPLPPEAAQGAGWTGPLPRPGVPPPLVLPPRPADPLGPSEPE